jgi:hypothetical protein
MVPWVLGKPHDTVDIFQMDLQKPLAMCQSNSISSLGCLSLAEKLKQISNIEAHECRKTVHQTGILITFFFTILTISLNMSRSTICWWTISPQFLLRVSSTWHKGTSQNHHISSKERSMNISKSCYVHNFPKLNNGGANVKPKWLNSVFMKQVAMWKLDSKSFFFMMLANEYR